MRAVLYITLAAALLLPGCVTSSYVKTAKRHAALGNYGAAAEYGSIALFRSPDDAEVRQEITAILLSAYTAHFSASRELASRGKYMEALTELERVTEINAIGSSVGLRLPMEQIEQQREQLLGEASQYYFNEAQNHMTDGEVKEAAEDFRMCAAFSPGRKDCKRGYKEARKLATKTVAIVPFRSTERPGIARLVTARFASEVKRANPEFVKFTDRDNLAVLMKEQEKTLSDAFDEAEAPEVGKLLGVTAFVFGEIVSCRTTDTGWTSTRSSNSVELPLMCKDEKGKEQECGKKTYTASWVIYSRDVHSSVVASFKIVETATSEITSSESVSAESSDYSSYARCAGDREALPPSIDCSAEMVEPRLAESLLEADATDVSIKLARQFYRIFR